MPAEKTFLEHKQFASNYVAAVLTSYPFILTMEGSVKMALDVYWWLDMRLVKVIWPESKTTVQPCKFYTRLPSPGTTSGKT